MPTESWNRLIQRFPTSLSPLLSPLWALCQKCCEKDKLYEKLRKPIRRSTELTRFLFCSIVIIFNFFWNRLLYSSRVPTTSHCTLHLCDEVMWQTTCIALSCLQDCLLFSDENNFDKIVTLVPKWIANEVLFECNYILNLVPKRLFSLIIRFTKQARARSFYKLFRSQKRVEVWLRHIVRPTLTRALRVMTVPIGPS